MNDPTPENVPAETETEAEIEEALTNGLFPDEELGHTCVLVKCAMMAVGAEVLLAEWADRLDALVPLAEEDYQRFIDRTRDWVWEASHALQEYLKVHTIPYVLLPNIMLDCGHVRTLRLAADR